MPPPDHFEAMHLLAGVVPAFPLAEPPAAAPAPAEPAVLAAALDLGRLRVDLRADVLDAWRDRLGRLPAPPAPATLQETVQAARARLRADRAQADVDELDGRRFVLAHLRDGLP
ncbi:hypothetical protein [Micromonospora sp. NPDC005806]|uniref:hypothetical protein n=1 Tax=Micromonospora sp. NPDC005806 TaxID=3364234 RepID=UPI00367BA4B1